jgi:hypothetical protein
MLGLERETEGLYQDPPLCESSFLLYVNQEDLAGMVGNFGRLFITMLHILSQFALLQTLTTIGMNGRSSLLSRLDCGFVASVPCHVLEMQTKVDELLKIFSGSSRQYVYSI